MDDAQQLEQQSLEPSVTPAATTQTRTKKTSPKGWGRFLGVVILVLVIWLPALAYVGYMHGSRVRSGQYQAVFLTNGQVYFGKLSGLHTDYPELRDIYYLIVTRPLQSQQTPEASGSATPPADFSLRKLGNELHGPDDRMLINKRHILFVEDLKDAGKVVEAIKQAAAAQPTAPQP